MNDIQIFNNPEFGEIRTVEIDGEPWFVGKDVAAALGYERPTKAVQDHVDEDDRIMVGGKTQSQFGIELGQRGGWLINESGVYSLVLSSKLPTAKSFKRWITHDVIPTIRKTGGYQAKPMSPNEMFLLQAQVNMENERQIREQERRLSALETDVSAVKETFSQAMNTLAQPAASPEVWQREMENTIRSMCAANGLNFHTWRAESYKELEQRAGVDLTRRQENRRKRMKQGGATYKERQGVSKLSIIADDRALRELYTSIVRRAEARNIVGKM